jgi:hypothetical protein
MTSSPFWFALLSTLTRARRGVGLGGGGGGDCESERDRGLAPARSPRRVGDTGTAPPPPSLPPAAAPPSPPEAAAAVLADDVDAASPLPTLPRSLSRLPTERGLLCRLRRTSTGEPWDCSGADDSIGDTPLRDATAATATAGSALASLSSPESLAVGDTHATPCQKKTHERVCERGVHRSE